MSGFVFVSYSRDDRPYVDELAAHLRAAGIGVWFDYGIVPGDRFASAIQAKIDACVAFVVVVTPSAMASKWVDLASSPDLQGIPQSASRSRVRFAAARSGAGVRFALGGGRTNPQARR